MRRRRWIFFVVALLGCRESQSPPAPRGSAAPSANPSDAPLPPAAAALDAGAPGASATRCLPVVAADCGCVYSCGAGTRVADGSYSVVHAFWKDHPLRARIDRWCQAGECTEAFFAEIVCSAICAPKPADPTCRFEGGVCRGRAE